MQLTSTRKKANAITSNILNRIAVRGQRKVADALHMDTSTLCRKLNGNRTMYIDEFASICQLLELSADRVLEEANA